MRIRHLISIGLVAFVSAGLGTVAAAGPQHAATATRYEHYTSYFLVRVDEYVSLHRRLENLLMPEKLFIDPRQDHAARMALADLVRAARPAAREGDFFCPDVAEVFRVRIAHALIANRVKASDLLRAGEDEELPDVPPAVVNQAFSWQSSNVMWPSMLHALPQLPEELEYRFVGVDLILIDVHANLVVDILRNSLPVD